MISSTSPGCTTDPIGVAPPSVSAKPGVATAESCRAIESSRSMIWMPRIAE
jgi:hypothetical protein